ncbi:MAG: type II toxin-antitoxin system Phd/YefM family antitoxin [Nitrospirae bacterium]|nr:type II toxin-antitoxin system Phd/YefM family antitoxin [Nitrospirota bacterium]
MDNDHGKLKATHKAMQTISVSKFKATCLSLLETVRKTGKPILVTKRGEPLAQVVPPPSPKRKSSWLGCMAGTATITGDIIAPAADPDEWEAERD